MSQSELLKKVIAFLTSAGVDYMVTGSVVSSLQGEPRASHDVDVVVLLPPQTVDGLIQAFPPPDFYLSKDAVEDAVKQNSQFNLLSMTDGNKVDFWLLTDSAFDLSRFARRYAINFEGVRLQVSAAEDTILAKLHWAKLSGGSDKQFQDALGVFELQRNKLDTDYLNQWASNLGVNDLWTQLQAKATPE
jgi:hypothetical protein